MVILRMYNSGCLGLSQAITSLGKVRFSGTACIPLAGLIMDNEGAIFPSYTCK
jgi:hypothetical protein